MLLRTLTLLLAIVASPAAADVHAVYKGQLGYTQRIEIAANGDMRGEMNDGRELIVRGSVAHVVEERLTGPIVSRAEDVVAHWRAVAATRPRGEADHPASIVERGTKAVEGRTGRAYYLRIHDGSLDKNPILVIGDDPALRPLGPAMARITRMEMERHSASDSAPFRDSASLAAEMARIIESGAPLQIGQARLVWIETAPIPPERFALPAEPETREALSARLAAEAKEEEADEGPSVDSMIASAAFSQSRLWLLTDSGRLSSLAETDSKGRAEHAGGYVRALCAGPDGPVAMTSIGETGQAWTLQHRRDGRWTAGQTVASANDVPIALACFGDRQLLLTSKRLITLSAGGQAELKLSEELRPAQVAPAVHVTADHLFWGINAGEWGGGLIRVDRRTGRVVRLERNATGDLCDGPLNTACDPVNGIASIPWKPGCVAAAVGLIHMMARGRIVEICGGKIERLYAKSMSAVPPEELGAGGPVDEGSSVAFFGLVETGGALLASGHDGLYRFRGPGRPAFEKLPRFKRVGDLLVSFALPDAVLVITQVHRRASVSGGAPLIVKR